MIFSKKSLKAMPNKMLMIFLLGITSLCLAETETDESKEKSSVDDDVLVGEEMIITTGHKPFPNTTIATPSFDVSREDINKTNLITASDAIKMAPSVHVRRRFYGDTNGITAIRGSTNMQTNHFNMYVDGIPLHNPVQTKWNGAPKWTLIAPNALHSASVFYGPHSVEHKGAFGGTFDLKTRLPDDFEMYADITGLFQTSDRFGQEELLTGHKEFISVGNRFDKFSVFAFFNHLDNDGQAQSFVNTDNPTAGTDGLPVTGSTLTRTINGDPSLITGDLGINNNITKLYALKLGYDFTEDLRGLFTLAFEHTERLSQSRSYIRDDDGNTVWGGQATQNGLEFDVNPGGFSGPTLGGSENERKTLMYGLNLSGKISQNWDIDTTASYFDAFKDRDLDSFVSQNDPAFAIDKSGRINDVDVWWADFSAKLATTNFMGRDDIGFMGGYQFNHSFLDLVSFDSSDVIAEREDSVRERNLNGGSTQTHSAFMHADWDFIDQWNILAGFRYDHWEATRGHIANEDLPDRDASRLSPKVSLSFKPMDLLSFRYSFTKAYRFPVAEELFESSRNITSINISDPNLGPETGYFHDFVVQYELPDGYASATLFYNQIDDEILRTRTLLEGGVTSNRTRSIDETETIGIELAYQQNHIMDLPISLSLNGTWINKEVKRDKNNAGIIGNEWVRIPRWRAKGTATYHITPSWDAHVGLNYRSKQFTTIENSDIVDQVYGASDEHVLLDFKTAYNMHVGQGVNAKFSFGIDNILDEDYYDFHPYPQRTYFVNVSVDYM